MSERPPQAPRARLLLFERDPGKRYHFEKYVVGIICRGLTDEERQQRVLEAVKHGGSQSSEAVTDEQC